MTEEVFIETVIDTSNPCQSGEFFVGYKDAAGEKQYYRVFVPSGSTIQELTEKLTPGTKVATLNVNGAIRCLVIVEGLDERGHLESWRKIGIGHYSYSEQAMLKNNTPIVH